MAEAVSQASVGQQALYPPPPAFYRLYRQDADGTADRPLPPEPPAPVRNDYQVFGEMHTVSNSGKGTVEGHRHKVSSCVQRRLNRDFRLFRLLCTKCRKMEVSVSSFLCAASHSKVITCKANLALHSSPSEVIMVRQM